MRNWYQRIELTDSFLLKYIDIGLLQRSQLALPERTFERLTSLLKVTTQETMNTWLSYPGSVHTITVLKEALWLTGGAWPTRLITVVTVGYALIHESTSYYFTARYDELCDKLCVPLCWCPLPTYSNDNNYEVYVFWELYLQVLLGRSRLPKSLMKAAGTIDPQPYAYNVTTPLVD